MKLITYDDVKLSKLSLGTVQFGLEYGVSNIHGKPTQNKVDEIIDYVTGNGINCFDTARAYGDSEKVLGESLKEKSNQYIVSKLKSDFFENDLLENITESLNNLKVEKLFGLLLHDSTLLYKWNDSLSKRVDSLIKSKKVSYFGVSIYTSEDFELALNNDKITIIQIPFNLFDQRAILDKWFEKAKEKNKLIFIRSVFLQGLLVMDKKDIPQKLESCLSYIDELDFFCTEFNLKRSELALNFVNSVAKDAIILFGCDTLAQAKENIKNFNSLVPFNQKTLNRLINSFQKISEDIYNPSRW